MDIQKLKQSIKMQDKKGMKDVSILHLIDRLEKAEAQLAEERGTNRKLRQDRAGLARECNAFEAQLEELAKQEPDFYAVYGSKGNLHSHCGSIHLARSLAKDIGGTFEGIFTRAVPPAPVIDPITVKALWPNPVRWDYQSEREYLGAMSMLKDCETVIKAAGGSVADE